MDSRVSASFSGCPIIVPVEKLEARQEGIGLEEAGQRICPSVHACVMPTTPWGERRVALMMKGACDLQGDGGSAPDRPRTRRVRMWRSIGASNR
jgi:hypothetical protein